MPSFDVGTLVDAFRDGAISRRDLIRGAIAAGLPVGAATRLATRVGAQSGSPAATSASSVTGAAEPGGRSINREEYQQLVRQTFDLSKPEITGGEVIYGMSNDVDSLHPHLAFDVFSLWVTDSIYEALVTPNATNGFPAPGLADFWELAEDGVTYTFHLSPNATWHDGTPVTADDVVFSFAASLDETSLTGLQSLLDEVLASYRAVDDSTVELVAREPLAVFVENSAALVTIVPKHIWESVPPSDWGSDPGATGQDPSRVVGSGPFRFVERVVEDHVTVARNAEYWNPERVPVIDRMIFRAMTEPLNRSAALTTGEIDFARLSFIDADVLAREPGVDIIAYDDTGWIQFTMNLNPDATKLFVDIPVRQALLYALDRQLIVDEIFLGYATEAHGTQPPLSIAYAPDRIDTIYGYDPDKARQLLDAAGWVAGDGDGIREKDGVPFAFECLYADNNPAYQQLLPYMQQAWREVGIDLTLAPVPLQTYFDLVATGDYEMGIQGKQWGVDGSQGDLFRCDAAESNGFNEMGYCNPRYDELDARQITELNVDRRIDLLIEQTNIVNDEVAVGILVFPQSVVNYRQTLHNFLPNGYSYLWSMPWWWTEVQ